MSAWRGVLRILGVVLGLVGGPIGKLIGLGLTLISQGGAGKGVGGLQSSPRYGFDTLSNPGSIGGPVPVVYGQELVAPQVISTNVVQTGQSQTLKVLCLVSEGEIESITGIRLNETPIESFTGAVATTRLGTSTQTALPEFNQRGTPYDSNTTLGLNATHVHEMRAAGDEVVFNLLYPGGIWGIGSKGDVIFVRSRIKIEWKRYGEADAAYAPWIQTQLSDWQNEKNGTWRYDAKTTSQLRLQMRLVLTNTTGVGRGRYVFRLTGQQANEAKKTCVPNLTSTIEISSDQRTYPGMALLGLTLPASAQLAGAIPRITCVVKGRKLYDPRTGTTAWSRNPILILRDLLLNTTYGLGRWISSSEIDDGVGGSFRTVADACDADVTTPTGVSEDAHQFDMVLDVRAPSRDWVDQITRSCRTTLFSSHGKLRVARFAAGASVRTFSENEGDGVRKGIVAMPDGDGSTERSTLVERWLDDAERWNAARFLFADRDDGYRRRTVVIRDQRIPISTGAWIFGTGFALGAKIKSMNVEGTDTYAVVVRAAAVGDSYVYYAQAEIDPLFSGGSGSTNPLTAANPPSTQVYPTGQPEYITPERVLETQLFGVTRRTQAQREARHHMLLALYCPRFVTFDVFLGDLDLEPGDHIAITSSRLGYSAKQFTVLSIAVRSDGFGTVEAREYEARVFTDGIDPVPNAPVFQPGGTIPPGLRLDAMPPEGQSATVAAKATTAPPPPAQTNSATSAPTAEATDIKVVVKEKV
jgi:hypothetical protein